ncbi:MAG: ABC transporter permease [Candidatus Methanosuratincola sp.]|jgi:peptide/nickel transport system permease protein/oligopeptide transport system permease protein
MTSYILRRLFLMLPVLLGISVTVFSLIRLIPGDPVDLLLGQDYKKEVAEQLRAQLGLDKPVYAQYGIFLRQLLKGDLGYSIRTGRPVAMELVERLKNTVQLAAFATILASVIGIASGVLAGTRPFSWLDGMTMAGAVAGVSIPVFWLGLMLIYVFAVRLQWLPAVGIGGFRHLVLPGITLSAFAMATIARQTRASMLEVMGQDYIKTARAKGVRERHVILRHALKNAMIPVLTVQGVMVGQLLGGSIVTETVFAFPGMGKMLIDGILERDYPIVQGAILLYGLSFSFINLVVDLAYALLDPRIAYD